MMLCSRLATAVLALATLSFLLAACGRDGARQPGEAARPFSLRLADHWIGNAICYGPYRDGQRPGGPTPSVGQIREDLQLMLPYWQLLRVYGSTGVTETILQVIHDENLPMKVMLGAWIDADDESANRREVREAIRLARRYPEIVMAVCVGNETQVDWSAHRSPLEQVIEHVRAVRGGVDVPVTSADDIDYWLQPGSRTLAQELDFITWHAHPMWKGQRIEDAMSWLETQAAALRQLHPDQLLVLGETGWATSVADTGEQAELIKGRPGEAPQWYFHDQVRAWAERNEQTVFWFEAFDENWKGGDDPAEVEKHWGLFRADRTAKRAIEGLRGTR